MRIHDFPISVPSDILKKEEIRPEKCIFFDIETTGLSWRRSHLYLLGAVYYENAQWIHRQWFCQRPKDEEKVLRQFDQLLERGSCLVHYNGATFDVPYLKHKFGFYGIERDWDAFSQIDLYQRLHPYKKVFRLLHMRQKDLETLTGLHRKDPFSGADLISCYQDYLASGEEKLYQTLSLHNQEDVEGLLQIIPLLNIAELFQGTLLSEPVTAALQENQLHLKFALRAQLPLCLTLPFPWFTLEIQQDAAALHVPLFNGSLKYFFPNYKDYYYLPLEDEAIHKRIGIYVDQAHRVPAKASTCYKKMTGRFLPQFTQEFSPALFQNYRDRVSWFPYEDAFLADPDTLIRYIKHLLRQVPALSSTDIE